MKKEKIKKLQGIYAIAVPGITLGVLSIILWFSKPDEISVSERRKLAQFPSFGISQILDGSFMKGMESYSQDQFPFRDSLRRLKSNVLFNLYRQKDVHGIYVADGYAASIMKEINEGAVRHSLLAFNNVYEKYIKDGEHQIYMGIVPDKGYYLAEANGYPSMDYEAFFKRFEDEMPYASFIDLTKTLTIDSYYRTDSHWKQECLKDTADAIRKAMNLNIVNNESETVKKASDEFYGVYYGQAALPMKPDEISYIDSDVIANASVFNFETGKTGGVYDWDKLSGYDPYDFFLSGSAPLLTIENSDAETKRQLIVFRDSYAGSLLPLLVKDYSKIVAIDIRYIYPDSLDEFIDFESLKGADVLYLYGTILLNDSSTLKR